MTEPLGATARRLMRFLIERARATGQSAYTPMVFGGADSLARLVGGDCDAARVLAILEWLESYRGSSMHLAGALTFWHVPVARTHLGVHLGEALAGDGADIDRLAEIVEARAALEDSVRLALPSGVIRETERRILGDLVGACVVPRDVKRAVRVISVRGGARDYGGVLGLGLDRAADVRRALGVLHALDIVLGDTTFHGLLTWSEVGSRLRITPAPLLPAVLESIRRTAT